MARSRKPCPELLVDIRAKEAEKGGDGEFSD
jgi:hypothetical protein